MQALEFFHSMTTVRFNINHTYVTLESNGMQYINGKHTCFWTTITSKHGSTPLTFTLEENDSIRLTAKFGDEVISIVYKDHYDVPLSLWLNTHVHYWTTQATHKKATHKKATAPETTPTVETTETTPTNKRQSSMNTLFQKIK